METELSILSNMNHLADVFSYCQYWYELFLDDLPMWGMVGEILRDEQHGRFERVIL